MFACGLHSFFNHSLAYLCLSWEIHASEPRGGKAVCFSNRVCLCRIYMDVLPNTLLFFLHEGRFRFAWGTLRSLHEGAESFGFACGVGVFTQCPFLASCLWYFHSENSRVYCRLLTFLFVVLNLQKIAKRGDSFPVHCYNFFFAFRYGLSDLCVCVLVIVCFFCWNICSFRQTCNYQMI